MDRFKQLFGTINAQLGQFSVASKLLVVALVGILILSLVLAANLSSSKQMTELMPGMPAEDQAKAKAYLEKMDIPHTAKGGKIMVPPEMQSRVIAALGESGQLPQNTEILFANLASRTNWTSAKSEKDFWNLRAIEGELAKVIKNFRNVDGAKVLISNPEPVGLGAAVKKPTAMVTVFMKGGRALDRNLVDAVAAMVAGAQSGLAIDNVKVIDGTTGRQMTPRSPEDFRASDYMEHKLKVEESVQAKVADFLRYIPNVIVAVNASVDVRRTESSTNSFLPAGKGSVKIEQSKSEKEESVSTKVGAGGSTAPNGGGSATPGFGGNATADIERSTAATTPGSSKTDNDTKFQVGLGSKTERVVDNKGMPTAIAVAINLPREYIADIFKAAKGAAAPAAGGAANATATEPTDAELQATFAKEKSRLEADLAGLVKTAAADASAAGADGAQVNSSSVSISMIPVALVKPDGTSRAIAGIAATGASDSGSSGGALSSIVGSGIIKQAVLGVLALLAIGAMVTIVKKAGKPIELPTAESIVGLPPALAKGDSDLVGEADEGQMAMEGIELQDDQLKTKKMLEQVSEMVKKNPQDAAQLLNRWMTSTE